MITLHHLNNSRSQRILWLLEELGMKYEIKRYERNKITMLAPPELKKVHPLGKSPVITDGELAIAESGAIIEYLIEKYGNGKLKPAHGSKEALYFTYWLHFAEGSAMPPLLLALMFHKIEAAPAPFFVKPILKLIGASVKGSYVIPTIKGNFEFVEKILAKNSWFTGEEFTAADIQMSFPLEAASTRPGTLGPKTLAFLEKIHARPAYKKAIELGGKYQL